MLRGKSRQPCRISTPVSGDSMYAAARGNAQMVELLIRNGADVAIISKEGDTALELALKMGSTEVADIIKKARAEQLVREEALAQQQK